MRIAASQSAAPAMGASWLYERSLGWHLAAAFVATLFLALSSYVEVPMFPVPMTMQTFAVTLVGALYGWRLGALAVTAWLLEAVLGLPVLAGGAAGPAYFLGPTAGYLLAFPFAAALVGWLVEHGWNGQRAGLSFLAMLIGNFVCLALGAAWLAVLTDSLTALTLGVTPFVLGAGLKSVLAAATLWIVAPKTARSA